MARWPSGSARLTDSSTIRLLPLRVSMSIYLCWLLVDFPQQTIPFLTEIIKQFPLNQRISPRGKCEPHRSQEESKTYKSQRAVTYIHKFPPQDYTHSKQFLMRINSSRPNCLPIVQRSSGLQLSWAVAMLRWLFNNAAAFESSVFLKAPLTHSLVSSPNNSPDLRHG